MTAGRLFHDHFGASHREKGAPSPPFLVGFFYISSMKIQRVAVLEKVLVDDPSTFSYLEKRLLLVFGLDAHPLGPTLVF
jgi:hypothetical protein